MESTEISIKPLPYWLARACKSKPLFGIAHCIVFALQGSHQLPMRSGFVWTVVRDMWGSSIDDAELQRRLRALSARGIVHVESAGGDTYVGLTKLGAEAFSAMS